MVSYKRKFDALTIAILIVICFNFSWLSQSPPYSNQGNSYGSYYQSPTPPRGYPYTSQANDDKNQHLSEGQYGVPKVDDETPQFNNQYSGIPPENQPKIKPLRSPPNLSKRNSPVDPNSVNESVDTIQVPPIDKPYKGPQTDDTIKPTKRMPQNNPESPPPKAKFEKQPNQPPPKGNEGNQFPRYTPGGKYGIPSSAPSPSVDQPAEDEDFQRSIVLQQWNEQMSNFEPSDILTINIASRTDEVFYDLVTEIPTKIRGAYFVGSGEK